MVPLLIMATSLVSKINTSVALVKGWVNSFLAFMGQVYIGFYTFYQVCITNITSGVVTFNIQQSEYTNDPPFP